MQSNVFQLQLYLSKQVAPATYTLEKRVFEAEIFLRFAGRFSSEKLEKSVVYFVLFTFSLHFYSYEE